MLTIFLYIKMAFNNVIQQLNIRENIKDCRGWLRKKNLR